MTPERDETMTIMQTTDSSFEADVLQSETPVVVDFWAEWCGPCKSIAPYLEELAKDKCEAIRVAKVNIDENPLTPTKYGVRGIPTLRLFKNGELAATKVGAVPKTKLYEWVDESI
jgi:thioredoxin 1